MMVSLEILHLRFAVLDLCPEPVPTNDLGYYLVVINGL